MQNLEIGLQVVVVPGPRTKAFPGEYYSMQAVWRQVVEVSKVRQDVTLMFIYKSCTLMSEHNSHACAAGPGKAPE